MNTAIINKNEFDWVCKIHAETGITYLKKWFSAVMVNSNHERNYCFKEYEDIGFIHLYYEYAPGVQYPDCGDNCKCRIIFKV